jgi:membrane protease YdiL (CAAX protease family)
MNRRRLLLIAVGFEGGLVLVAWGLGAWLGTPAFGLLRLTWQGALWGTAASVPLLASLALVIRSEWPPFARFRLMIHRIVSELFSSCTVGDIALISVLAGIGEEALFRGVMQPYLTGSVGLWVAIAVTSVAFGLAHYLSLTYAIYAAVISAWLGFLLVTFDNLLVPITVHALYDFLALTYLVHIRPSKAAPGAEAPSTGGSKMAADQKGGSPEERSGP